MYFIHLRQTVSLYSAFPKTRVPRSINSSVGSLRLRNVGRHLNVKTATSYSARILRRWYKTLYTRGGRLFCGFFVVHISSRVLPPRWVLGWLTNGVRLAVVFFALPGHQALFFWLDTLECLNLILRQLAYNHVSRKRIARSRRGPGRAPVYRHIPPLGSPVPAPPSLL